MAVVFEFAARHPPRRRASALPRDARATRDILILLPELATMMLLIFSRFTLSFVADY